MEEKKATKCESWSYTTKYNGKVYHSKEYSTREELAAIISELIRRTPQRFTTINIIRTDYWR